MTKLAQIREAVPEGVEVIALSSESTAGRDYEFRLRTGGTGPHRVSGFAAALAAANGMQWFGAEVARRQRRRKRKNGNGKHTAGALQATG